MIIFMSSSQPLKISGPKLLARFTNSFYMITQICQFLSNYNTLNRYLIYKDNLFTIIKLFKYLRKYSLGAFGTINADLEFLSKLFIF